MPSRLVRGEAADRGVTAIVVTGLGTVNALAHSVDAFTAALRAGACAIAPVTGFDATGYRSRIAAEVKDLAAPDWLPSPLRRRASRSDLFALVAADGGVGGERSRRRGGAGAGRRRARCHDRRHDGRRDEPPRARSTARSGAIGRARSLGTPMTTSADVLAARLRPRRPASRAQHRVLVERHRARRRPRLDPSRPRRRRDRGRHRVDVPHHLRGLQRAPRARARAVPALRPTPRGPEPRRRRRDPRGRARDARRPARAPGCTRRSSATA